MYIVNNTFTRDGSLIEPSMYFAEYPSIEKQQRYRLQAGFSTLFVLLLISVAISVS